MNLKVKCKENCTELYNFPKGSFCLNPFYFSISIEENSIILRKDFNSRKNERALKQTHVEGENFL